MGELSVERVSPKATDENGDIVSVVHWFLHE